MAAASWRPIPTARCGVFDEAQRAPELLSYLQTVADADGRLGRYILTG